MNKNPERRYDYSFEEPPTPIPEAILYSAIGALALASEYTIRATTFLPKKCAAGLTKILIKNLTCLEEGNFD